MTDFDPKAFHDALAGEHIEDKGYRLEKRVADVMIPSGYVIVPAPDENEERAIDLLEMQLLELKAILDDRRIRVNAMEAALHAAHHYPERALEDLFDSIYEKLLGGS